MWRFSVWGVAGLTAACELSKAGVKIALFEKRHTLVGKLANLRWKGNVWRGYTASIFSQSDAASRIPLVPQSHLQ